jgi:putative membrane-bound dehydrogenase-like protein
LPLLPLLVFAPAGTSGGEPPAPPENRGLTPPARQDQTARTPPPAGFHHVKLNGHTFTLPVGFTVELAAGPDLAARPIVADFDDKGRLYVCDSSGSNEKVEEQLKKKPHRIMRLEDTNGDGRFDKSTVYVPNVMFPEGAMWRDGSLYVGAPPHILKFTDTNDDGTADKEEVWFDGKTLTGCANDLHGPYAGPDGLIYWCKGAFAKQEYVLPNGKKLGTRAAHIFRARPDGTGIEPVMTGGMDNPVDVVFTPGGERIFTTTFFQHPGGGRRDGLVHAVYGGVYGKDHDPVYEHPWTSPSLMPVMTHMGPAAPAGLHRYESDQFGPEYTDNLFACQFNLRKVSRHVLVPTGSTFTTKDSDFVVSDNLDFHPTDVIEDADGSLLIVDTGGWYKLCCPTSQLVKPDVTGAIYRVRKVGGHKVEDPRGTKIDWRPAEVPTLIQYLDDPRPAVRRRAVAALAAGGLRTVVDLDFAARGLGPRARLAAVWAACASPDPGARAVSRLALADKDDAVVIAAVHAAALWRDAGAAGGLSNLLLNSPNPHVRRAAAEALGRIGDKAVVPDLLKALADETTDRVLDHSLTYALIEIGDPEGTADGLIRQSPRVRRAALAALDAMPEGKLDARTVLAELDSKDAALRETAWWVAGKHPDWGDKLAGYFAGQLKKAGKLTPAERDELVARLAKFAKSEAVQKVLAAAAADPDRKDPLPLRAVARSGVKPLPGAFHGVLTTALIADDATVREAFAALRSLPVTAAEFTAVTGQALRVIERGYRPPWPAEVRLVYLASAPAGAVAASDEDFALALKALGADETRSLAADALARAKLTPDQQAKVATALKTVGPLDRPKLLAAFERTTDESAGRALVEGLSDPAVRGSIRVEQVKPILDKYPPAVRAEADKLYTLLAEARKDETAKLDRLLKELPAGDVRRGQVVFNGQKAQCIACHQMGYVGGKVGPDLTRIGGVRTERDLLEAIVFPSASFVRSYEPVRVVTADGRTLSGILTKDAPDEVVLAVAADKDERIPRADVESISPGTVSVMPAGLDQQLTPQDLADLVAFLKASR